MRILARGDSKTKQMTDSEIYKDFLTLVARGERHRDYHRTLEVRRDAMAYVTGQGLDDKLRQFVRREDDELFRQRVSLTHHIVTAVSANLLHPHKKVPRSNSGKPSITYGEDSPPEKLTDLTGKLAEFWNGRSWNAYMKTRFFELVETDPNAWVVFEFADFDANVELATPYPYEVLSTQVVGIKRTRGELDYIIVKGAERKIRPMTESHDTEAPTPLHPKKKDTYLADTYTLYGKNRNLQLIEVHISEIPARAILQQEGAPFTSPDGRVFFKLGASYFEGKAFKPHNIGQVPAICVGYLRDPLTNGRTFLHPLHNVAPFLEKTIKTNSELDLVASLLAFPQVVQYTRPCSARGCSAGTNTITGEMCTACAGLGLERTAPSSQDAITIALPRDPDAAHELDNIIKYVHPPVDIVKWQADYIQELTRQARRYMYNTDVFDRASIQQTATGRQLDLQNVYDTLWPWAEKYSQTWPQGVTIIARIIDRAEGLIAAYPFSKDFKLKSMTVLIEELEAATKIGNTALARHISDDIASIMFDEKPQELAAYRVKAALSPFAGKSEKETLMLMVSNYVPEWKKVLHANFESILLEVVGRYGTDFYEYKTGRQAALLRAEAQRVATEIQAETPEPTLTVV